MSQGRLGQGKYLNNVSRESHIGGPTDGSPLVIARIPTGTGAYAPTIAITSPQLNGVATAANHITKILGRAAVMKRVDLRGSITTGTAIWADLIKLVGWQEEVDGKLLSVADTDGRGVIGQVGFNMEFEVPQRGSRMLSGVTRNVPNLDAGDIGKRIIGCDQGSVMVVDEPTVPATFANLAAVQTYLTAKALWDKGRGKITRVITDNENGTGHIQVDLWL